MILLGRFFDSAYHLSCPYDSLPITHSIVMMHNLVSGGKVTNNF